MSDPAPQGAMASHNPPSHARQRAPVLSFHALAGAALIAVIVLIAYFPCLSGEFILDDHILLTENSLIKAPDGLYRIWFTTEAIDYWPVVNSSFWFEWRLWGMHSTGYHVTNLIVHVADAWLIWAILWRLSIPGAFLAALLFAVHPVNVESVAWIAQRKNLLALFFLLLSILSYLRAEAESPRHLDRPPLRMGGWYWLSVVAFVLAMLSKGSVATLPLLLVGVIWWLRPLTRWDLVRAAPFFLVGVVLVLVNVWFQARFTKAEMQTVLPAERLLGAGAVVWFYLAKALLPLHLSFVYPKWHIDTGQLRWWLPLLAVVAVTAMLWRYRRRWSRPLLFAWGWFCASLVPVMGFTDVGFMHHSLVADHYQHVALIGVIALVAAGWGWWQHTAHGPTGWVPNAAAAGVVGALALLTWQQSALYADGMTLYRATLEENPDSSFAHNNLGLVLLDAGRPQEASEHFEQALRLTPDFPEVHYNLGRTLFRAGQLPEAIGHYEQALRLRPNYPEYHRDLGAALAGAGQLPEALGHFEEALRLRPEYPEAHFSLGCTLVQAGRLSEAIEHFQQALRLNPDYAEAHNNLGGVLFETGRPQEAIEQYGRALQLEPDFAEAQANLGRALFQAHQVFEAIDHFQQALRLKPDLPEIHNDLGVALADQGQFQEAIVHFARALQLRPDDRDARNNLEETLAMQQKATERGE